MSDPTAHEHPHDLSSADVTCTTWLEQLRAVEIQLSELANLAGPSYGLGPGVYSCLAALDHFRSASLIQMQREDQMTQALATALSQLETFKSELAISRSLTYQIDMLKLKR